MRHMLKVSFLACCAVALPSVASARVTAEMRALELSRAYLSAWSSPGHVALARVKYVYAPQVHFYGRTMNHSSLYAEKRRFIERCPFRRYGLVPGSVQVSCTRSRATCTVTAMIRWRAENRARRAVARGTSRFSQTFHFGSSRPVVTAETGSVLRPRALRSVLYHCPRFARRVLSTRRAGRVVRPEAE